MPISQIEAMEVLALIRHFEDRCSSSFKNNRRINDNVSSSNKVSSLVQKFEVKTSCCAEASEDSVCSSVVIPLNNICSMFKRNAGSCSSIGSIPTVSI